MAKGFYLGSRLRRYAHANQFGAENLDLKAEVKELIETAEEVIGSNIKGTLVSDVFHFVESDNFGRRGEPEYDDLEGEVREGDFH